MGKQTVIRSAETLLRQRVAAQDLLSAQNLFKTLSCFTTYLNRSQWKISRTLRFSEASFKDRFVEINADDKGLNQSEFALKNCLEIKSYLKA